MKSSVQTELGILTVETFFERDRHWLPFRKSKSGEYRGEVRGQAVAVGRILTLQRRMREDREIFDPITWEAAKAPSFPVKPQRGHESGGQRYHDHAREKAQHFALECCTGHLNYADIVEQQHA